MLMMDDTNPHLLTIVVDVDFASWKARKDSCPESCILYQELVSSLIIFCNAYCLMHRQNRLCVLAALPDSCIQIYPRRKIVKGVSGEETIVHDDFVPLGHLLPSIIASGLLDPILLKSIEQNNTSIASDSITSDGLSKALSKGLCIINRQVQNTHKLQPRILVIQLREDHAPCYNNIMNSIFSADRLNSPIDSMLLSPQRHSHFLQQASYLTRGVYLRPLDQRDILNELLTQCLSSTTTREILQGTIQRTVDFRASCSCHKKPVEFAYMCSVCLALFCDEGTSCAVCGTMARSKTKTGSGAIPVGGNKVI